MSILHTEAIMERARENYDPDDALTLYRVEMEMTITRQFEVMATSEDAACRLAKRRAEREYPSAEDYYAKDVEVVNA